MRVVLGDEARTELREATARYRRISKRLALRFADEIKRAQALIAADPSRWLEVEPGIRRVLLRKFPYALLYALEDNRIVVLVVKHHKRHPQYWHDDR
jgi:plasmid stabilization system protein ParE